MLTNRGGGEPTGWDRTSPNPRSASLCEVRMTLLAPLVREPLQPRQPLRRIHEVDLGVVEICVWSFASFVPWGTLGFSYLLSETENH